MKARCVEHDVELTEPNANGDSYCPSCALGWFEKSGGRSHQALAKAVAHLLQERRTSRAECAKHGEVDLTRPDDAGNSYCPSCIIEGVSGEVLAKYAARVPSSSSPNIQNAADAFKRVRELEEENAKLRLKETLAVVGSHFLKFDHESDEGFVREHEGRFLVCRPTLLFSWRTEERLFEVVADCRDRGLAEVVLKIYEVTPDELKGKKNG